MTHTFVGNYLGETRGLSPRVVGGIAVSDLTMPTALRDATYHIMTRHIDSRVKEKAQKGHADRVRDQYDTTNLAAIMARYHAAVSGGRR